MQQGDYREDVLDFLQPDEIMEKPQFKVTEEPYFSHFQAMDAIIARCLSEVAIEFESIDRAPSIEIIHLLECFDSAADLYIMQFKFDVALKW